MSNNLLSKHLKQSFNRTQCHYLLHKHTSLLFFCELFLHSKDHHHGFHTKSNQQISKAEALWLNTSRSYLVSRAQQTPLTQSLSVFVFCLISWLKKGGNKRGISIFTQTRKKKTDAADRMWIAVRVPLKSWMNETGMTGMTTTMQHGRSV